MSKTQTVTILFCDLVSSTERRARLGDDAFDEFTSKFMAALRAAIADAGGREASNAGDGLMVVFPDSVADSVACASAMHRGVAALDPRDPPQLRVGISTGEVAQDGDDFSGMPIVEAARLEAAAEPGKTLASAVVRSLVGTRRAFRFRDVGALTLKGLPVPLATVEVVDDEVADLPRPKPVAAPRSRRARWLLVAGTAALGVVLLAVGVVALTRGNDTNAEAKGITPPKGYTPRYEKAACSKDVGASVPEATCGQLVVPQDRAKPRGKQVRLFVERAPARSSGAAAAPSIDLCSCEDLGSSLVRDHAEVIRLSSRGFQGSDPLLTCPEMTAVRQPALTLPTDDPGAIREGRDALTRCHARLVDQGIDPAQYNFDTAAQDVVDLMVALKIPRADFTAFEDVSMEVFGVLRRAPGAVRSITLDNPLAPGRTAFSDPVGDLAGAFDRFVALCTADPTCARAYPDLPRSWRSAHARYAAKPPLVTADNPDDPNEPGIPPDLPAIPVLLDGPRVADALGTALGEAKYYGLIPAGITEPSGDTAFATAVTRSDEYSRHPDAPWGGLASYVCAYDVHTEDPSVMALAARTLPQFVRGWLYTHWAQWCQAWPVPDVSETLRAGVAGPVPALFFRGDISPDGNPDWIRAISRNLPNAQTVLFPTLGGRLLDRGPPCLSDLRRKFLANPSAKLDTAACEKQSPPIQFVAPTP